MDLTKVRTVTSEKQAVLNRSVPVRPKPRIRSCLGQGFRRVEAWPNSLWRCYRSSAGNHPAMRQLLSHTNTCRGIHVSTASSICRTSFWSTSLQYQGKQARQFLPWNTFLQPCSVCRTRSRGGAHRSSAGGELHSSRATAARSVSLVLCTHDDCGRKTT